MMHDKFKKRYQAPKVGGRARHQIAVEAARRLFETAGPVLDDPHGRLRDASESEYYTAKRKAAAVLGHRIRPGDLPSDSEIREQILLIARSKSAPPEQPEGPDVEDEPAPAPLERFALYRMRLAPLEAVKQNPARHPEGDALYHSLQVFGLAREARPYDEEFLLAALLHDVGKAIDPANHVAAGVEALRHAVTERTLWLIEHQHDLAALKDRGLSQKARRALEESEYREDLALLEEADQAGRVPGALVGTIDDAIHYIKGLEDESYLDS